MNAQANFWMRSLTERKLREITSRSMDKASLQMHGDRKLPYTS